MFILASLQKASFFLRVKRLTRNCDQQWNGMMLKHRLLNSISTTSLQAFSSSHRNAWFITCSSRTKKHKKVSCVDSRGWFVKGFTSSYWLLSNILLSVSKRVRSEIIWRRHELRSRKNYKLECAVKEFLIESDGCAVTAMCSLQSDKLKLFVSYVSLIFIHVLKACEANNHARKWNFRSGCRFMCFS